MSIPHLFARSFHVVDGDHGARAAIARQIAEWGGHAEIYEDLNELVAARPSSGAILIAAAAAGRDNLAERLCAGQVFLPVILFAEQPTPMQIIRAAHDGVADYLTLPFDGSQLMAAFDYAQRFMQRNGGRLMRRRQAQSRVAELTDRERQVLSFLLDGHSNKSIGKLLELSPRTVEDYRLKALRKLGVTSTSAAIRIGFEAELATVSETARAA